MRRNTIKAAIAILTFTTIYSPNSNATSLSIEQYERLSQSENPLIDAYITGVAEGISWANTHNGNEGQDKIYCAPESLALNSSNYRQVLDQYLDKIESDVDKETPDVDKETPIALVMMYALKDAFPCT